MNGQHSFWAILSWEFGTIFDWTGEIGSYLTESGKSDSLIDWAVDHERLTSSPGWLILGVSTSLGSTDSWSLLLEASLDRSYRKYINGDAEEV